MRDGGVIDDPGLSTRSLRRRTKEKLEGSIRFALAKRRQTEHLRHTGGVWALREADDTYNDLNREMLSHSRKSVH